MKIMRSFAILLALVILMSSCSGIFTAEIEDTGILADRNELDGIKETANIREIVYREGIGEGEPVFYWTENGSVFHGMSSCSMLANSDMIICGNLAHAVSDGILNSCSRCFDKK